VIDSATRIVVEQSGTGAPADRPAVPPERHDEEKKKAPLFSIRLALDHGAWGGEGEKFSD
jgi:hypothetical protein